MAQPWPSEGLIPKPTPGSTVPAPKHISLSARGQRERGQHAVAVPGSLPGPGSTGTWSLSAWEQTRPAKRPAVQASSRGHRAELPAK